MSRRMNLLSFLVVVFCFAVVGKIYAGETIYVDADRPVGGGGTSWNDAFRFLQDALAVAVSTDEILVAQGTYKPDEDASNPSGSGLRTATFQLISGVAVYGGYAGFDEPNPDDRDVDAYETILSGNIGAPDDNSDNSYHVVTGSGTASALIDGFTITGGYADGGGLDNMGAGMFNESFGYPVDPGPTVVKCTFRDNSADMWGGAVCNSGDINPTFIDCLFEENSAPYEWPLDGGAMKFDTSYASNITLTNCRFLGNASSGIGAGGSWATLTNCVFSGNSGHGISDDSSIMNLTNCVFSGNSGWGIHMQGATMVTNCTFSGNSGGGLWNPMGPSHSIVTNCIFWGNGDMSELAQLAGTEPFERPTVSYSCIQALNIYAGNHNIGEDPQFEDADGADDVVGTEDDNLRLNCCTSPCIDAADNDAVPADTADLDGDSDTAEPTPLDLDNKPRFVDVIGIPDTGNAGVQGPPVVDMGAYEAQCYIAAFKDDIKWSQPPQEDDSGCINGWDEVSDYNGPHIPIVADDWLCLDDRPIKDIHWWGSFKGWTEQVPPDKMPAAFHIGIWTDVPDPNPCDPSHPGELVWENVCDCYVWSYAGCDEDPRSNDGNDACFKFDQLLSQDKWFYQEPGGDPNNPTVYWLSIAAIYEGTRDYVIVDDFERYFTRSDVRDVWKDGCYLWENGSNITLSTVIDPRYPAGHEPPGPIHEGLDALQFVYDNDRDIYLFEPGFAEFNYIAFYYFSEMKANITDLEAPSDWITEGFQSMSIWFYGDPGNDIGTYEQMYLALEDVDSDIAIVNYENMDDLKINEWQLWCIDLQDFTDANPDFDLTGVNRMYIGFGERYNNVVAGGSGVVYFDDIGLHREPLCVREPSYPWGWKTRPHFCKDDAVRITGLVGQWPPVIGSVWEDGLPIEFPKGTSWDMAFVLTTNRKYTPRKWFWPDEEADAADIYPDGIINFRDFAVMADHWREEAEWFPCEGDC